MASTGLSSAEAAARLAAHGPNDLPRPGTRGLPRIIIDVLKEPMLALLLGGGLVYLLLGERTEALVLVGFAGLSILITVVQEQRTERALAALRDLASPRALVIRDGQRQRIAGRDVVVGDVLVLGEGDRVPADGWLLQGEGLLVDESLLTGESLPVSKQAADAKPPPAPPGGDGLAHLHAGTLVVRGAGLAQVTATGATTHMGQIGTMLATVDTEVPRLTLQTRRLVLWFAGFGLAANLAAVLLWRVRPHPAAPEVAHRRSPESRRRGGGDDRRRRERRARLESRAHRRRHGRPRHRCGARSLGHRAARR